MNDPWNVSFIDFSSASSVVADIQTIIHFIWQCLFSIWNEPFHLAIDEKKRLRQAKENEIKVLLFGTWYFAIVPISWFQIATHNLQSGRCKINKEFQNNSEMNTFLRFVMQYCLSLKYLRRDFEIMKFLVGRTQSNEHKLFYSCVMKMAILPLEFHLRQCIKWLFDNVSKFQRIETSKKNMSVRSHHQIMKTMNHAHENAR